MTDPIRPRSMLELLTYKMDRTIAVVGLVVIGGLSIGVMGKDATAVLTAVISALGVVLGAKIGKQ
jgi:predicted Rossmann-fold nucleotide-binding protein